MGLAERGTLFNKKSPTFGPGLHNFAAYTGGRVPPELEGLPMTASYNIDLPRCTEEQKEQFYAVLGRNPRHPMHIPSQYE